MRSHWSTVSPWPNSPEAKKHRENALLGTFQPLIHDRIEYLKSIARGRRVLDVGVVEHDSSRAGSDAWLHRHIAGAASYCLGIDILEEGVRKLAAEGYNVAVADITRDTLAEKFEVIIAGEVIEHLPSPQSLFRFAFQTLVPGGVLVFTTPNPYFLGRIRRELLGVAGGESVDHVIYVWPSGVVEMAEREGLFLKSFTGTELGASSTRSRLLYVLRPMLRMIGVVPHAFSETLIYQCQKPEND